EYPFTRGIHPTGYRGKLWTMRQFAGFGSPRETNERYKFLLEHGTSGLSVAFDFPTLMGYDSDHPRSEGEVGKCGVAISSLKDMEDLFEGIPLDKVSTSMTINGPAIILWAFYIAAAEKKGDRKSTRLNSSHVAISYAVFCLKKKKITTIKLASGFDRSRRARRGSASNWRRRHWS